MKTWFDWFAPAAPASDESPFLAQNRCAVCESMAAPALLRHEIRALVFDQYGTVVDMQKG
jgi:hypothetical protein